MANRMLLLVVLAGVGVAAVGCSAQSAPSPTASAASAPTSAPSTQVVNALPDSIPLPPGAELAEGTKSFVSERAQGWTAVALTPTGTGLGSTATQLNQSLQRAGWTAKLSGTERDGYVLSCTRMIGAQSAWLNVNVTTPVPGSGPAVTYRYAVGLAPSASATP